MLSFVIPCYRSEYTVADVVSELVEAIPEGQDYEIICVNDCSPDGTLGVLGSLADANERVRVVDLAKNVGQHNALMAGYRHARGDIVVTLEDDGQSPAREYRKLVDLLDEGYDVVYAQYGTKKQSAFRNFGTRLSRWMGRTMMGATGKVEGSSFFAARRFVIDSVLTYRNPYPFVHGLINRATAEVAHVPIEHRARAAGSSGYTLKKLAALWLNGCTTFSVKPLRIFSFMGAVFSCLGLVGAVVLSFFGAFSPFSGMFGIWLLACLLALGGIVLLSAGMLGEYVGRSYLSLNRAPQYVVRSTRNIAGRRDTADARCEGDGM